MVIVIEVRKPGRLGALEIIMRGWEAWAWYQRSKFYLRGTKQGAVEIDLVDKKARLAKRGGETNSKEKGDSQSTCISNAPCAIQR